jgi:hypothetical protein
MKDDPIEFKISFPNSRINGKPQPVRVQAEKIVRFERAINTPKETRLIEEFNECKEFDTLTRYWNMVTKHVKQ